MQEGGEVKGSILLLLLGPLFLAALPGAGSAVPFFDFYGYSYSDEDPLVVGSTTTVPVRFNTFQPEPVLPFDFASYEVTALIDGLQVVSIEPHGTIRTLRFDGGEIRVFQDGAMDSQWSAGPPNDAVPSTFHDGEMILIGYFSDCLLIYDTVMRTGTVQGHVDFTGGSRWGELAQPGGWLFYGGITANPQGDLPEGYAFAWDPQLLSPSPVATRRATWGAIKGLYR